MNNMALIMIGQERFEEALPPLARATQIDSSRAFFWNNLGMALERTGRYRSAEQAYSHAFEADEGHEKAYANLVRVQGVDEQPGVETIDLGDYAQRFIETMEDWKSAEAGNEDERSHSPDGFADDRIAEWHCPTHRLPARNRGPQAAMRRKGRTRRARPDLFDICRSLVSSSRKCIPMPPARMCYVEISQHTDSLTGRTDQLT